MELEYGTTIALVPPEMRRKDGPSHWLKAPDGELVAWLRPHSPTARQVLLAARGCGVIPHAAQIDDGIFACRITPQAVAFFKKDN